MFQGRCPGLRWVRPLAFGGPIRRAMPWATMGEAFGLWGFYPQGDALGLWVFCSQGMPWATMGKAFGLWVGVWGSYPQGDALGYDGSGLWGSSPTHTARHIECCVF